MKNYMESLEIRRSQYALDKNVNLKRDEIIENIKKVTKLVPDAFNMRSQRVVALFDKKHEKFWDSVYEIFDGKVSREKTDMFKNAYGTLLFFYDKNVIENMKNAAPSYADRFENWARESGGMLQYALWTSFSQLGMGASLQHYNPVIDEKIKEIFDIPQNYVLTSQLVFGNIVSNAAPKDKENIDERVKVLI